ncbi:phytanoyl-CoA dioxygenase family protein [Paenibacillus eucommiae]|uniref:Ectoine hydroxylase-related dioxygenase (Phytanoyl-CoA dioxygenase family) n=1 Tax=Paenibacillus eucommiae TaxID=1355755 RepID=A0ABS4J2U0_9BACL|nr:phytanoyl-CoA dioxygenase family protein [Paenibacillus eucommiae]MBP1993625.1 ectoine hydroxylase-related dioxygenase (phytanoyl-CoA dioxygenase family) [Paenibacillus eucommiae]
MSTLSDQQLDFFETFGFLKFPGLLQDSIGLIIEEFEAVFKHLNESGPLDEGLRTRMIAPFIDQRVRLSALLEEPQIQPILTSLLGEDYNYMGSDGNYYTGNTPWHPDGSSNDYRHIKIAFYLDTLGAANGALRVIPGSHLHQGPFAQKLLGRIQQSAELWGMNGDALPSVSLDVVPGDILVFDHNLFHSSWGGSQSRRMFTINACQRYQENDIHKFRDYLVLHHSYQNASEQYYGPNMLKTADSQRKKHLEQVLANVDVLTV